MFPLSELLFFNDLAKARSGELNMAIDEVLLKDCQTPWMRFYTWAEPTISIGYFMPHESVDFASIPWVRRWTGGGMVSHGVLNEVTFSIGFPMSSTPSVMRPSMLYREIHKRIQCILNDSGIPCHLEQGNNAPTSGGLCFENPVTFDVIDNSSGSKIVGGAQRKTRHGLLHQGSINGPMLSSEFNLKLARDLSPNVATGELGEQEECASLDLASLKYSTPQWRLRK